MKKLIALCALSLSLLPVGLASAQDANTSRATAPDLNYDFDDEVVDGTGVSSDLTRLTVRQRGSRGSLIRARSHFIPELTVSIERL